jgi:hypothetical protein
MIIIALGNIFTIKSNNKKNVTQLEFDLLQQAQNAILLLDYKLTSPKYNINKTWFVWLEICSVGKYALWVLHGTR